MSDKTNEVEQCLEEQALEYTQAKRKKIVETIMKDGAVPEDKGDKMALLTALSDMDKVSLTKLRIKADEKQSDNSSQASALLSKFLTLVVPSKARNFNSNSVIPKLESSLAPTDLIDGETAVGTQNTNYENFQKSLPEKE